MNAPAPSPEDIAAAREFLSQYCIAPGSPHWLAGERDFLSGLSHGREQGAQAERSNWIPLQEEYALVKEKLRIAVEALAMYAEGYGRTSVGSHEQHVSRIIEEARAEPARKAIAAVKSRGDWPLPEPEPIERGCE